MSGSFKKSYMCRILDAYPTMRHYFGRKNENPSRGCRYDYRIIFRAYRKHDNCDALEGNAEYDRYVARSEVRAVLRSPVLKGPRCVDC